MIDVHIHLTKISPVAENWFPEPRFHSKSIVMATMFVREFHDAFQLRAGLVLRWYDTLK